MTFQPLKRILPAALAGRPFTAQLEAQQILTHAASALCSLWGEERSAALSVVSFSDGVIKFESTSGAAMQQLKVDETRLVNEINRRIGARRVRGITARAKGF